MKRSALYLVLSLIFLEWLDFSLYLYLAKSVFAVQFFPPSSLNLTLSFALFTAAYFARPIGGWIFGKRADRNGRRKPMVFSAGLMGFATMGICLLPNYSQIGLWATWGLLIFRILQSLALGGEINTAAMFLVEHYRHQKPLFAGSLVAASGALGMFTGGAIASLLTSISCPSCWRLVFALVGGLSLWVCCLRKQLRESPEFNQHHWQVIRWSDNFRGLVNIAVVAAFVSITVYICNVFWVSYAIDQELWRPAICARIGSFSQFGAALLALLIARYAKIQHTYRLLQSSMIVAAITAPLLFYCTELMNPPGALLALSGYVVANGLICSSLYYFLYLQLPARCRCQGVSTVWAIAASIGTLSLPLSEQALQHGLVWFPGLSVSVLALIALLFCRNVSRPLYLAEVVQKTFV